MAERWNDWFEREEFIGQISDMRVQNLQGNNNTHSPQPQHTAAEDTGGVCEVLRISLALLGCTNFVYTQSPSSDVVFGPPSETSADCKLKM